MVITPKISNKLWPNDNTQCCDNENSPKNKPS